MSELPRFSDFRLEPAVSDEAVDRLVIARTKRYFSTGVTDGDRHQAVAVYTTMPDVMKPGGPIIRLPSWGADYGLPISASFDAYVAEVTGRPVISPNAPGVEGSEWSDPHHPDQHLLTPDQIEDLAAGSFRLVAAATIEAAYKAAEYDSINHDCIIHGASMGAALAAGAIRAIMEGDSPLSLGGICLSEGVNYTKRGAVDFNGAFRGQRRTVGGYLAQNPARMQKQAEDRRAQVRRIRHSAANAPYVLALPRGKFLADIGDVSGLRHTSIILDRGGGSKMSSEEANQYIIRELSEQGVPTRLTTYGVLHKHGYIHTPKSVINAVHAHTRSSHSNLSV